MTNKFPTPENNKKRVIKTLVDHIERFIIRVLILLMAILLVAATIELAYQTFTSLFFSEHFLINTDGIMDLFGVFLLVLIGIELLDTIKVYFKKNVVHVEVVILVAIIAIARKVIVLDFEKYDGLELLAIGVIIVALSVSYYMIKKAGGCQFYTKEKEVIEIDPETQEKTKIIEEKTILNDNEKKEPPPCGGQ